MDRSIHKLEDTKGYLEKIVNTAKNPIVCWSGGKDSNLIVLLLKQLGYSIPCLVFPQFWSTYQKVFIKKMVKDYKLQCFYYRPTQIQYDDPTIIAHYTLGPKTIPVFFDVVYDENSCGLDKGKEAIKGVVPYFIWDRVLVGTKKLDRHDKVQQYDLSSHHNIDCPLWGWTDEEVMEVTKQAGFPYDARVYDQKDEKADTGNYVGCMNCFTKGRAYCPKVRGNIRGIYGSV